MVASQKIESLNAAGLSGIKLIAVALFLILTWGSAFTMVGVAVRTLSPDWLVAYRMIVGAIVVGAYGFYAGHKFPPLRDIRWIWYAFMALAGASLPFVMLAMGQQTVDSGLTAIIVGTMPLITIILAHFFTSEKLTLWKFIGFLMGFMGIVVLFMPENLSPTLIADWRPQLLILGAAACYAIVTITASRAPDTPSSIGAAMMLSLGALLSTLWASFNSGSPPMPNMIELLCILGLGFGSTGVATMVLLWIVDTSGPSLVARINYFVPVCSVILGVVFLNEELDWRIFFALFVILLGIIISRIGEAKKLALKVLIPLARRRDS